MGKSKRYAPEVKERAVRMVLEREREHDSQWAAIRSISSKIGCSAEALRSWVRQAERVPARLRRDAELKEEIRRAHATSHALVVGLLLLLAAPLSGQEEPPPPPRFTLADLQGEGALGRAWLSCDLRPVTFGPAYAGPIKALNFTVPGDYEQIEWQTAPAPRFGRSRAGRRSRSRVCC